MILYIKEDNKRLLRLASEEERAQLPNKLIEELKTLQVCREKVIMRSLPMEIRDAEYQFDHHKLTFYFEADRRIDFRDLVSDLFALYKTRYLIALYTIYLFISIHILYYKVNI